MSSTTETSIDTSVNELTSAVSSEITEYEKYLAGLSLTDIDPISAMCAYGLMSELRLHTALCLLNSRIRDDVAFDPVRVQQVKSQVILEVFGSSRPTLWVSSSKKPYCDNLLEVKISEFACQVIPRVSWFLLFSRMLVKKVCISVEPNMREFLVKNEGKFLNMNTNGVLMVRKAAIDEGGLVITRQTSPKDDVFQTSDTKFKCSTWAVELTQSRPFEEDLEIARFFYGELEPKNLLEKETDRRPLLTGCYAFSMQLQFVT